MSVILNDITGKPFDLTKNPLFIDHYNNHASWFLLERISLKNDS